MNEQQAREIIKRISDAALDLAFVRHDLTGDTFDSSDYPDVKTEIAAREAWWEGIKEDTLNCLTGDDFGCLDEDELSAKNCERLFLEQYKFELST
jgi:hypothetical protein